MPNHTEEDHRRMILTEDDWPCWPFLPMKKPSHDGRWPQLGLIIAGSPTDVLLAGLYDNRETLLAAPFEKYDSVDALLIDGWIVD